MDPVLGLVGPRPLPTPPLPLPLALSSWHRAPRRPFPLVLPAVVALHGVDSVTRRSPSNPSPKRADHRPLRAVTRPAGDSNSHCVQAVPQSPVSDDTPIRRARRPSRMGTCTASPSIPGSPTGAGRGRPNRCRTRDRQGGSFRSTGPAVSSRQTPCDGKTERYSIRVTSKFTTATALSIIYSISSSRNSSMSPSNRRCSRSALTARFEHRRGAIDGLARSPRVGE